MKNSLCDLRIFRSSDKKITVDRNITTLALYSKKFEWHYRRSKLSIGELIEKFRLSNEDDVNFLQSIEVEPDGRINSVAVAFFRAKSQMTISVESHTTHNIRYIVGGEKMARKYGVHLSETYNLGLYKNGNLLQNHVIHINYVCSPEIEINSGGLLPSLPLKEKEKEKNHENEEKMYRSRYRQSRPGTCEECGREVFKIYDIAMKDGIKFLC